ncbi:MAG: hypothetical protein LBN98_03670 [Prevotellaceae bacterium]|jgi:hypothetical protein|nr:hypothetical protein [Prevotellaceae bacterium]
MKTIHKIFTYLFLMFGTGLTAACFLGAPHQWFFALLSFIAYGLLRAETAKENTGKRARLIDDYYRRLRSQYMSRPALSSGWLQTPQTCVSEKAIRCQTERFQSPKIQYLCSLRAHLQNWCTGFGSFLQAMFLCKRPKPLS